jgi:hypothetical protein
MILKKLSASDVGIGGQLAVNMTKGQVDFFNIEKLKNKSNLPNKDYELVFTEKHSSEKHPITLSYKPSSNQWRIIGLSNTTEFFQTEKTLEGDYLLINKNNDAEIVFEVQRYSQENSKFTDFLLIYFYLIEQRSFRDLDKKVYGITDQRGFKSQKHLKSKYDITDSEKKSFEQNGFVKEYENSKDKYRDALNLFKEYYTMAKQDNNEVNNITEPQSKYDIKKGNNSPTQKIYFGAPGTGKSHQADIDTKGENVKKTTFHPEYDYTSFVGSYKPTMEGKNIIYQFVPQIFTKLYIEAWKNYTSQDETQQYYLQIEEINRGNCAEIFGDLFQLLDRDQNGFSKYEISADQDLLKYLKDSNGFNSTEHEGIKKGELRLPPNFNLIATMNTSDQSLFPMDSAFKRRWDWQYIPIDTKCEHSDFTIELDNSKQYKWLTFLNNINSEIFEITKSQDNEIGIWFVNAKHNNNIISQNTFINKVIFYLWNDVFKDEESSVFKTEDGIELSYNSFFDTENVSNLLSDILEKRLNLVNLNTANIPSSNEE